MQDELMETIKRFFDFYYLNPLFVFEEASKTKKTHLIPCIIQKHKKSKFQTRIIVFKDNNQRDPSISLPSLVRTHPGNQWLPRKEKQI